VKISYESGFVRFGDCFFRGEKREDNSVVMRLASPDRSLVIQVETPEVLEEAIREAERHGDCPQVVAQIRGLTKQQNEGVGGVEFWFHGWESEFAIGDHAQFLVEGDYVGVEESEVCPPDHVRVFVRTTDRRWGSTLIPVLLPCDLAEDLPKPESVGDPDELPHVPHIMIEGIPMMDPERGPVLVGRSMSTEDVPVHPPRTGLPWSMSMSEMVCPLYLGTVQELPSGFLTVE